MSDSESTNAWVTVAEAAEKASVDSGTVRQWYRAGRIPTRRAEGERGAFLVPLELVLSLVDPRDVTELVASSPSIEAAQRDAVESSANAAELETLQQELAQARDQLEFLRAQLAEATDENRTLKQQLRLADDQRSDLRAELADAVDDRKGVEARLLTVEAELTQLRRTAARSSITDSSWLDQQTPAYESPVRRQAMTPDPSPAPRASSPLGGGPTSPFSEDRGGELADLLSATRPDRGSNPDDATTADASFAGDVDDEYEASRAIWTDEAPHPPLGESPDDLLPEPEKKSRFGKK